MGGRSSWGAAWPEAASIEQENTKHHADARSLAPFCRANRYAKELNLESKPWEGSCRRQEGVVMTARRRRKEAEERQDDGYPGDHP